jgi:hypothetical protein
MQRIRCFGFLHLSFLAIRHVCISRSYQLSRHKVWIYIVHLCLFENVFKNLSYFF